MSALSSVEVLRGAKAVLERNGWHQGYFYDNNQAAADKPREECPVCGLGAVRIVAWGTPAANLDASQPQWDAYIGVSDLLDRVVGDDYATWQDRPGRTLPEVLAVFDKAIERAEAGEVR